MRALNFSNPRHRRRLLKITWHISEWTPTVTFNTAHSLIGVGQRRTPRAANVLDSGLSRSRHNALCPRGTQPLLPAFSSKRLTVRHAINRIAAYEL